MKKVYDTLGFAGVVLMLITALLSDSGAISIEKTIILGIVSVVFVMISLGSVNVAEYTSHESAAQICMTQNEQCVQKSA